jgi:hypothetical protein
MENLKREYRDLEQKVLRGLRDKVSESEHYSKHVEEKCVKVNLYGYTELTIINDQLAFLDGNGQHYSIWNGDCQLEDLIDILTEE